MIEYTAEGKKNLGPSLGKGFTHRYRRRNSAAIAHMLDKLEDKSRTEVHRVLRGVKKNQDA